MIRPSPFARIYGKKLHQMLTDAEASKTKVVDISEENIRLRQQLEICKKVISDGKDFLEYLNTSGLLTGDTNLKKHLVQEMESLYKSVQQAIADIRELDKK